MADTLADLVVKIGADISGYTKGLQDATEQLSGLSHGLEAMGEKLGELAGEFLAFEGLKKLAEESIEAAAGIEKTKIALTALTGSASIAADTIEKMEALASSEALSFPELLAASQHMTAVGMSLEQIEPALAAAGNAAWALGASVSDVASRMEGMSLSGMAGGRQLKALGLTSDDLGKVLGVAGDKAAKMFKALDETSRTEALTLALAKFGDVATKEADATTGSWINLKNAWHGVFVEIGDDLLPIVNWLEKIGTSAAFLTKTLLELKSVRQDLMAGVAGAGVGALAGAAVGGVGAIPGAVVGGVVGIAGNQIGRQLSGGNAAPPKPIAPAFPTEGVTGYVGAAKAANDLAEAIKNITNAANDNLTAFGRAEETLKGVAEAYKYGYASADQLRAAQDAVKKAFADANPDLQKWATSAEAGAEFTRGLAMNLAEVGRVNLANFDHFITEFQAGNLEAPVLVEHLAKLTEGQKNLDEVTALAAKGLNYLNDAYKTLGLTMDGVSGSVSSKVIAAFDLIAKDNTTTADGIQQAWGKASTAIDKLAKTDLPAAIAQYQTYISTLQRVGASQYDIQAAQEKQLQLEIQIAGQRGTDATKEIVQLTDLQEHTKNLSDASSALGNVYVGLVSTYDRSFAALSKGIADNIVDLKNWGDMFKGILQSIEKEILENLIGYAFKELAASLSGILGTGGLLGKIGGALGGAGSSTGQTAGITAQTAAISLNTASLHALAAVLATHGGILAGNTGATATDTLATGTGTVATTAHTSVLGAHLGVLSSHLGVMTAHMGTMLAHMATMIGNTVSVLANTLATIANSVWLAIKSALSFFGFAEGGRPPLGRPSIVGEKGPELFVPDGMGTIIPNDMLHSMAARVPSSWVPSYEELSGGGGYSVPGQAMSGAGSSTGSGRFRDMYVSFPNVKTVKQSAQELANLLGGKSVKFQRYAT